MTTYESLSNARKQLQNVRKSELANARSTYLWGFSLLALAACGSTTPGVGGSPAPLPSTPSRGIQLPDPSAIVGLPGAVASGDERTVVAIEGQFVELEFTDATATYVVRDADGNEVAVNDGTFYAASTGEYTITISDLKIADGKTAADVRLEITRPDPAEKQDSTFIERAEAKTDGGKSQIEISLVGKEVPEGTDVKLVLKSGGVAIPDADYTVTLSEDGDVITVTFEDDKAPTSFAGLTFELGGGAPTSNEVAIVDNTDTSAPTLVSSTAYDDPDNTGRAIKIVEYSDVDPMISVGVEGDAVIIVLPNSVVIADDNVLADILADLIISSGTGDSATPLEIDMTKGSLDGNVIHLTLTTEVGAGDAITVDYRGDSIVDASDRPFQGTLTTSAVNSTAAVPGADPVVTLVAVTGSTVTITFDKPIGAASATDYADDGDFTVMADGVANVVTAASINGPVLTLTLTTAVTDGTTLSVSYDATGSDTLSLVSIDDTAVAVANVTNVAATNLEGDAPAVTKVGVDGDTIIIAFDQDLAGDTATPGDFTLTGTTAAISSATISGDLVTLTLDAAVAATDALTVAYAPSGTTDLTGVAGTAVAAITATDATNVTGTAPEVATATADGTFVVLTFNRDIAAGTTAVGDFVVKVGTDTPTISAVLFDTNTVTLTLDTPVVSGASVTVEYTGSGTDKLVSTDATAVAVADIATAQAVTNTTLDAAAAPKASSIEAYGSTVVVTFDKDLATVGEYTELGDFTVSNGASSAEAPNPVTAASVSGNVLTLTLTNPVVADDSVLFSYDANSQDTASLKGTDTSTTAVMNFDDAKVTVDPALTGSYATGTTVYLVFNVAVAQGAVADDFTVMTGATGSLTANTVTTVTIVGSVVALTMTNKIADSDEIKFTVTADKLAGLNGAKIDLTAETVVDSANVDGLVPPTISGITVNGTTVEITFSANLTDVTSYADTADFTLTGIGDTNEISGASVAGAVVTLTLSAAVASDAVVTVAYASAGAGTETLKDANGLIIADTTAAIDAKNNTPAAPAAATAPVFEDAVVNVTDNTITLTYDVDLTAVASGTAAAGFTVVGVLPADLTVAVTGTTVILTVGGAGIADGTAVSVAYDPTATGAVQITSDADSSKVAAAITATDVANELDAVTGIALDTAATKIVLTFDAPITAPVAGAYADAEDFTVTVAGAAVTGHTVAVAADGTVEITLAAAVTAGQTVDVAYASDGAATVALETGTNVAVGNFNTANKTAPAVTGIPTAAAAGADAPKVTGATVSADGTIVTLTFDKDLDSADTDSAAAASYEITAGSATYTPATATLDGATVTLTLTSGDTIFKDAAVSVKIVAELDASDAATNPVAADTTVASTDVTNGSTEEYSGPTAIVRENPDYSYSIILDYKGDISEASFDKDDFSVKYGRDSDESQKALAEVTVSSAKSISGTEIELKINSVADLDNLSFRVDYTGSDSSLDAIGGAESFAVANEIGNADFLVLEFDEDIHLDITDGLSVELTLADGKVATVVSSDLSAEPGGNLLFIFLPEDVDLADDGTGSAYTKAVVKYTGTGLTDSSGNPIELGDDSIVATINNPSGATDTRAPTLVSGSAENDYNADDALQARVYLTFNEAIHLEDDSTLELDDDGLRTGLTNASGALQFEGNFTVRIGDVSTYQLRQISDNDENNNIFFAWVVDADGNAVVLGRGETIHVAYADGNLEDSTGIFDLGANTLQSFAETQLSTNNVIEFAAPTSTTEVTSENATSADIAGEANETIQAVFYKVRATTDDVATEGDIYDGGNGSTGTIAADGTSYSFTASPEAAEAGTDYVVDILLFDQSGNSSVVSQYFNTAVELDSEATLTADTQAGTEDPKDTPDPEADYTITGMSITKGDATADPVVTDKLVITTDATFADQAAADAFGTDKLVLGDFKLQDLTDTSTNIDLPATSTIAVATDGTITIDLTATSGLTTDGTVFYQLSHTAATATANGLADATAVAQAAVVVIESVSVAADGTVVVTFDEDVAATTATAGWKVTVNGAATAIDPDSVASAGKDVTLTLPADSITAGDDVTVTYDPAATGADVKGVAVTWTPGGVVASAGTSDTATNNISLKDVLTVVSVAIDGTSVVVTFDADPSAVTNDDLSLKVGDTDLAFSGSATIDATAKTATFTLATAVSKTDVVTVAFDGDTAVDAGSVANNTAYAITGMSITKGDATADPVVTDKLVITTDATFADQTAADTFKDLLAVGEFKLYDLAADTTPIDLPAASTISVAPDGKITIDLTATSGLTTDGTVLYQLSYTAAATSTADLSDATAVAQAAVVEIESVSVAADGTVVVSFDEDVATTTATAGWSVTVNGAATAIDPTAVASAGKDVTLTLPADSIAAGDTVTVSYDPAATGADVKGTATTWLDTGVVASTATSVSATNNVPSASGGGSGSAPTSSDGAVAAGDDDGEGYFTATLSGNALVYYTFADKDATFTDLSGWKAVSTQAAAGASENSDTVRIDYTSADAGTNKLFVAYVSEDGAYKINPFFTPVFGNTEPSIPTGSVIAIDNAVETAQEITIAVDGLSDDDTLATSAEFSGINTGLTVKADAGNLVFTVAAGTDVWAGSREITAVVSDGTNVDTTLTFDLTVVADAADTTGIVQTNPTDTPNTNVGINEDGTLGTEFQIDGASTANAGEYYTVRFVVVNEGTDVPAAEAQLIDFVTNASVGSLGVLDAGQVSSTDATWSITATGLEVGGRYDTYIVLTDVNGNATLVQGYGDAGYNGANAILGLTGDVTPPTFIDQSTANDTSGDGTVNATEATGGIVVTYTFSEEVWHVDASDFTPTGGTILAVTPINPIAIPEGDHGVADAIPPKTVTVPAGAMAAIEWAVTITPTDNAVTEVTVKLKSGAEVYDDPIASLDVNPYDSTADAGLETVKIDQIAATVAAPALAQGNADVNTITVVLTFNDLIDISVLDASMFTVAGATVSDLAANTATSSELNDITLKITANVDSVITDADIVFTPTGDITDIDGNKLLMATVGGGKVTLDGLSAKASAPDAAQGTNDLKSFNVEVTFDDNISTADVSAAMFTVAKGTETLTKGTHYTIDKVPNDTANKVTLKITATGVDIEGADIVFTPTGNITDTAGNELQMATIGGGKLTLDGVAALIDTVTATGGGTNTAVVTLTFDDTMTGSDITIDDFVVTDDTGGSGASTFFEVSGVAIGTGNATKEVLVTVSGIGSTASDSNFDLDYATGASFTDTAGNTASPTADQIILDGINLDTVASTINDLTAAQGNADINFVDVVLTFSDDIDTSLLTAAMFTVAGATVNSVGDNVATSSELNDIIVNITANVGSVVTNADIVFAPGTIKDTAGNTLAGHTVGGTAANKVTLDGVAAKATAVAATYGSDNAKSTNVEITFDDNVNNGVVTAAMFTLAKDGTALAATAYTISSTGAIASNKITLQITATGVDITEADIVFTPSGNITDTAGNALEPITIVGGTVSLDGTAATINALTGPVGGEVNNDTVVLTFGDDVDTSDSNITAGLFKLTTKDASNNVVDVPSGDYTITKESASGNAVTLKITATGADISGANIVFTPTSGMTDTAGNALGNQTIVGGTVSLDGTAATINALTGPVGGEVNNDTVELTFGDDVDTTAVLASMFTLTGFVAGTDYTLSKAGNTGNIVTLSIDAVSGKDVTNANIVFTPTSGMTDTAGNALGNQTIGGGTVSLDGTAPTIADLTGNVGGEVNNATVELTFNDDVDTSAATFTADLFTLAGGGVASGDYTIMKESATGNSVTLKITAKTGTDISGADIVFTPAGITDTAGNALGNQTIGGGKVNLDGTAPTINALTANVGGEVNNATVALTFNDDVDTSAATFTADLFTLAGGGVASGDYTITKESATGNVVTLKITATGADISDANIVFTPAGITDTAGNALGNQTIVGGTVSLDGTAATINALTGNVGGEVNNDTVVLTFNDDVNTSASTFTASLFTLSGTGIVASDYTITKESASGNAVTLKITATGADISGADIVFTPAGITDSAGNALGNQTIGGGTVSLDGTAATINALTGNVGGEVNNDTVELTFGDDVDTTAVLASMFTLTGFAAGTDYTLSKVGNTGNIVTLSIDAVSGKDVTNANIVFTPTSGMTDTAGNDLATQTTGIGEVSLDGTTAVAGNVDTLVKVAERVQIVTIDFDDNVEANPIKEDFTLTDGSDGIVTDISVTGASASADKLFLTLTDTSTGVINRVIDIEALSGFEDAAGNAIIGEIADNVKFLGMPHKTKGTSGTTEDMQAAGTIDAASVSNSTTGQVNLSYAAGGDTQYFAITFQFDDSLDLTKVKSDHFAVSSSNSSTTKIGNHQVATSSTPGQVVVTFSATSLSSAAHTDQVKAYIDSDAVFKDTSGNTWEYSAQVEHNLFWELAWT